MRFTVRVKALKVVEVLFKVLKGKQNICAYLLICGIQLSSTLELSPEV